MKPDPEIITALTGLVPTAVVSNAIKNGISYETPDLLERACIATNRALSILDADLEITASSAGEASLKADIKQLDDIDVKVLRMLTKVAQTSFWAHQVTEAERNLVMGKIAHEYFNLADYASFYAEGVTFAWYELRAQTVKLTDYFSWMEKEGAEHAEGIVGEKNFGDPYSDAFVRYMLVCSHGKACIKAGKVPKQ